MAEPVYCLKVTGTVTYTLRQSPSRILITGKPGETPHSAHIVMTRKPLLRWWSELIVWHCWKRWRRTRIYF